MDFGKLSIYDLEKTDLRLKPDNSFNEKIWKPTTQQPMVKVGCPVWSNKDWNGKIYPHNAKTQDFLKLYSHQFNTIELNVTHYQIPNDETIKRWQTETSSDFTFCPKFPQIISHDKLLQNVEGLTNEFCSQILKLDAKLGIPFLQLAPYFTPKQFPILEKYLRQLPDNLKIAVEFRHEDWFRNEEIWQETLAMLNSLGHATVITDVAGRRDVVHQSLSVSKAVIRWIGNDHPSDYQRIDEWIQRLTFWFEQGLKELWLFVHTPDNIKAPEIATYWIHQLNFHGDFKIIEPKFLPKVVQMNLFNF